MKWLRSSKSQADFKLLRLIIFVTVVGVIGSYIIWNTLASNPNLTGDENNDGTVNVLDLSILLSNWGTTNASIDLNGDGLVNITDLSILLSHWNQTAQVPQPIGVPGTWTLKFDDEFSGTALNKSVWASGWFGTGITGPVNTLELACYDSQLVTMPGDGYLHLNLIARANTCSGSSHAYTGSIISSNPSDGVGGHAGYQFTYGYKEFRVYLPPSGSQVANWPGIWSNGQNWPATGEDDVMEGLSGQACYHFHSPSGGPGGCVSGNYSGWHTFGSNWQPGVVIYYYDGKQVGQITLGITSAPHYLLINNSTSSSSLTVAPTELLVDYVRVWQ